MSPPLACFPVFTLFVALFLLMLLVLVVGVGRRHSVEAAPAEPATAQTRFPAWWTIALIPVVLAAVLWFLAWCTAGN